MLVQHTSPTYMTMTSWERRPTSCFASPGVGAATISPPCSLPTTSHEQINYPLRAVDNLSLRVPMQNLESNQLTGPRQTPQLSTPLRQPLKGISCTLEQVFPEHSISCRPPPSGRRGGVCRLHMPLARRPVSTGPPSVSLPVSPTPMFRIRDDPQSDFFWMGNSGSMSPHSNTSSNATVQSWPSGTLPSAESESSPLYSRVVFNPRTGSSAFSTLSISSKLSDHSASSNSYDSSIKSPDQPGSSSQERRAKFGAWGPNEAQKQAKNHSVISNRGLDQEASFRKHNLTFQGMLDSKGDFSRVRVWKSEKGLTFYDCTCGKRRPDQGLKKIKHHAQRHSIRRHACDICGKVYGHHCSLNAHKRVHKRRSASACEKIKPKLP